MKKKIIFIVLTLVLGIFFSVLAAGSGSKTYQDSPSKKASESGTKEQIEGGSSFSFGSTSKLMDIVDTARSIGAFQRFVAALEAADLVETLKGNGPFTVLMPLDEAFDKLPPNILSDLMKPANKQRLQGILKTHIIEGYLMGYDLETSDTEKAFNGQTLSFSKENDVVQINGKAKLVHTDVVAINGLIHSIDTVILPD